jgi:NAD(P) transhydrogenase subunit alpha
VKVGVPRERAAGENRCALVPETVQKLQAAGLDVLVESEAGSAAHVADEAFAQAGARVVGSSDALYREADAVLKVQPPARDEVQEFRESALLISFLQPSANAETVRALASRRVTAMSLELLPRISRAQSMDALSSQASLAGYKAVLIAAGRLGKIFPLLMTAAGTIAPARVLVLGAGVAGLQAIATARRLGAVVEAYDVRPAVKEEVQSLGARFIELPLEAEEGTGGYAAAQSEDFLRRQRELIGERVAAADAVITTAAIPGRRAPLLVSAEMVSRMRKGSVVVDLAAESGGNCELTRVGEAVDAGGVIVDGPRNVPSMLAVNASQVYARNVANLLLHLLRDGEVKLDFEDEITRGCCVTYRGEIVHPQARELLETSRER